MFLFTLTISAKSQVINYDTKISIDEYGTKTTKKTILIQVNSKEENWLSKVKIHHSPSEKLKFHYARILDLSGSEIRKIKKKDLKTSNDLSYQAFYQDDLITSFDLYSNQYPYRIEYSYSTLVNEYLYAAWWNPYLFSNVSTLNANLEVRIPMSMKIHINESDEFSHKKNNGGRWIFVFMEKIRCN